MVWGRTLLITMSLFVGLTIGPNDCSAQYVGVSAFAAMSPQFPCDRYLAMVNQSEMPAMAVLWGTFGDDTSCIRKFIESNKHRYHLIEIHFSDETCRRNRNCFEGSFFGTQSVSEYNRRLEQGDLDLLVAIGHRITDIRNFVDPVGTEFTTFVLSTGLEDNYSCRAYENLSTFLRLFWPYVQLRNPGNRAQKCFRNGDYYEVHGYKSRCRGGALFKNEDGTTSSLARSRTFVGDLCVASFVWRAKHQGRFGGRFVAPKLRRFEIPDADINGIGGLLSEVTR